MYRDFLCTFLSVMTIAEVHSTITIFGFYKGLGEKTFAQLTDEQLFYQPNGESNSVGILVKHLWGNMLSRWTNFLTEDGEKEWRERDAEFEPSIQTREELMEKWEAGWSCLFDALKSLQEGDLDKEVFIRNRGHTVQEAIQRQLAHYAYHVGQIIYVGKLSVNANWESLSIPKNGSAAFNKKKFQEDKRTEHFSEEFKDKKSNSS